MKFRRHHALLVTALLVIGMAAFGRRASAATADAGTPITIEFWDFPRLPKTAAYLTEAMARFERENPGVKIRYTRLPWQDGQQKVTLSVNSGRPPDVCGQVNVSPMYISQEVLEPLNDYLADIKDDFYPDYLDAVTYRGQIYAIPWFKACYVALLNLDLFEKFGVEPPKNGRWTWGEFLKKMDALTTTVEGRQHYGLVTNLGPMEYEAYSIIYMNGGRIVSARPDGTAEIGVNSAAFREGLQRLVDLEYKYKVCMPGVGAMTQEQSWNVWRDGRNCAVTFQGGWCITAVQVANEAVEETNAKKRAAGRLDEIEKPIHWAIAAPPNDEGTTPILGSSGLTTYVVFKQKDSRKRALCAKFARFLISGEGQKVLKYENCYPSLKSTGNLWADNAALGNVFELFPAGVMFPLVPGGERIDWVLQQQIQKALLRDSRTGNPILTVDQATSEAFRRLEAVLDRGLRRFEAGTRK
ncbi:MAG: sugar ABC transporter substrate-binding protein [Candidatus Sumerlaeaceae bacterium]|nr:sugar ABC transporter substrate-binding protein [Candidatus Sumerlaeaceae bacterium]